MHKNLLIKHSDFFNIAVNGRWKEGQDRVVLLEEDDPNAFEMFCAFLYTGQLFIMKPDDRCSQDATEAGGRYETKELERMVMIWILAEKLMSVSLKDAVVDMLVAFLVDEADYPTEMHVAVYPISSAKSAIRKLLVDIGIWSFGSGAIGEYGYDAGSAKYLFDMIVAKEELKDCIHHSQAPWQRGDICRYHEHVAEGKPCYKTMF